MNSNGSITLFLGPMFAGKSTELLRSARKAKYSRKKCILIKHSKDDRYAESQVVTHDGVTYDAISCTRLFDLKDQCMDSDWVLIDEGQFFQDIPEFADLMAKNGKRVVIAALDGTFERKPFNRILEVVPLAENVLKLTANCHTCGADAYYTKRLSDEMDVEIVGGADQYEAACRAHHSKLN